MTVSDSLKELLLAHAECEDAKASTDPYNWGYFGFRYREAVDKAEKAFCESLNQYVDARIARALEAAK